MAIRENKSGSPEAGHAEIRYRHRVIKVLYVEDDPDDQELFREMLADADEWGYITETVDSTRAATMCLQVGEFDIVFVDNRLKPDDPFGSGGTFLRSLISQGLDLPVVLITGQPNVQADEEVLRLINNGRISFVEKDGLTGAELHGLIHAALERELHLLLVEPDEDRALMVESCLADSVPYHFSIHGVPTVDDAFRQLDVQHFDVVVTNWSSGAAIDPELLKTLLDRGNGLAIVVLTEGGDVALPSSILRLVGHNRIGFLPRATLSTQHMVDTVIRQRARLSQGAGAPSPG